MAWFRDRLQKKVLVGTNKLPNLPSGKLAERQDVWEYPLNALREAIANAICHRDYVSDAATTIRLYDDYLTISNPGHLFYKLSADDLLREHDSYPPNKQIAESFYNVGLIERWGAGTLLIADALKAQGQSPPTFDVASAHTFKITLVADIRSAIPHQIESALSKRQVKAIDYLRSHPSITSAEYQDFFGASRATATRDLVELKQKGLIVQVGSGRGTGYRLSDSMQ